MGQKGFILISEAVQIKLTFEKGQKLLDSRGYCPEYWEIVGPGIRRWADQEEWINSLEFKALRFWNQYCAWKWFLIKEYIWKRRLKLIPGRIRSMIWWKRIQFRWKLNSFKKSFVKPLLALWEGNTLDFYMELIRPAVHKKLDRPEWALLSWKRP